MACELTTSRLGRNWLDFDSIDSTNTYLKERAFTLPHGTVVTAAEQTQGRGRRGNTWIAAPGKTLAMSLLLQEVPAAALGHLPLLCGIAVARALDCGCRLKWSNDVLIGDKKLCGILCESRIGEKVAAVCGFGINLAQSAEEFAAASLPYAGSLYSLTGRTLTPKEAASLVLNAMEDIWEAYLKGGFAPFMEEYRSLCVTLNRPVRVLYDGKTITAEAVDINPDGSLLCRADGELITVRAGEASVRGLYGYQ